MRLCEVEPPTDDPLIMYVSLEAPPTHEELAEFDRICRKTNRFDGWDVYGQLIESHPHDEPQFVVILANRARRL